jgi:2-polyprenyl-6-methoxyphenol hydroxylase-like FAD-dependent oxidoreductase
VSVATCRPRTPVPAGRLTHVPDSLSWTMSAPGPAPADTSPQALLQYALRATADFAPAVRRILRQADAAATFPVTLTSAVRVDPWHAPTVTLLGDAIHTMSPGRGDGATIALRDAQLLRDLLAEAVGRGVSPSQAKAEYEHVMLDYAFAAVEASRHHPFAPTGPARR